MTAPYRKKLIEVALPLEAVNAGCRADKNRKIGHIRNLHKWFAPMPLPAWRALLFASLVDDPGDDTEEARAERHRLLSLVERLSDFESYSDAQLLEAAQAEIARQLPDGPPAIVDPFCGGGSTILEAQRLGLPAVGSDLNPIPVLISTVLCRVPSLFRGQASIHPKAGKSKFGKQSALDGFVADVQAYAKDVRDRASTTLMPLYPAVDGAMPFAYRWAWTVESPDPAFRGRHTPLVSDWWLSEHKTNIAWVKATAESERGLSFSVEHEGKAPPGTTGRSGARCLFSGSPVALEYIRAEGRAGRLSLTMFAIAAKRGKEAVYLAPTEEQISVALSADASVDGIQMPDAALGFRVQQYGIRNFAQLFTKRQTKALATFASLVDGIHDEVLEHARVRFREDGSSLEEGGNQARAYADAVVAVLSLAVGKMAQSNNILVRWFCEEGRKTGKALPAFDRQIVSMVWDFVETNPFGGSVGDWSGAVLETALRAFDLTASKGPPATIAQADARDVVASLPASALIATDPPYYANIGYADLSDFFYLWIRPAARRALPRAFSTIATPKQTELIANPHRHENDAATANGYFRDGFAEVFGGLARKADHRFPMLIVYAIKQSEEAEDGVSSTGWEVFLGGLIDAGLSVVATWPVTTSIDTRSRGIGSNALVSAIFVIARERSQSARRTTRAEFVRLLRAELDDAIQRLKAVNIAPVDMAQAAIGPGIGLFSSFAAVLEPDGAPMSVRAALGLINEILDEILTAHEGDFDPETRFAVTWYEVHGFASGPFGDAETLAKARAVAVDGVVEAGIAKSGGGKVRLINRDDLSKEWDPTEDSKLTVWEATQHLIKRLEEQGEEAAAELLERLGGTADAARDLAYRLYTACERKGWAEEARAYNGLVAAWSDLEKLATSRASQPAQQTLI